MKLLVLSDIHANLVAVEAVLRGGARFRHGRLPRRRGGPGLASSRRTQPGWPRMPCTAPGGTTTRHCPCVKSFRDFSVITLPWFGTLVNTSDRGILRALPTLRGFSESSDQIIKK